MISYFEIRPFVIAVLVMFISLAAIVLKQRVRVDLRRCFVFVVMLLSSVVSWFLLYGPLVGREAIQSFSMSWQVMRSHKSGGGQAEVVLRFMASPIPAVGIYSDVVAEYLNSVRDDKVLVSFVVTRDYGRFRCYRLFQIGELDNWPDEGGYARVIVGDEEEAGGSLRAVFDQ